MRVPVRVEDDDRVSSLQVEAQTSGPGAEDEDEVGGVLLVEQRQQLSTVLCLCGAWTQHNIGRL